MKALLILTSLSTALLAQLQFPQLGGQPAPSEWKPETVVASVEGKDITLADVRKMVAADPRLMQFMQQNPQQAISNFLMMRHLAAEGEKQKLAEQSPLKEQIETMRAIALMNALVNNERDTFPVSSEMMDDYFQRNRAKYEQAHIKAIYLAFKPAPAAAAGTTPEAMAAAAKLALEQAQSSGARTEAAAEALAKDIVQQLRGGADFGKLVAQYSDDPGSKAAGGDFGVIKPNSSFPEAIRKAVFAMKNGDVSEPVKSGNAIYIIRLEEKVMPAINEVREEIVQNIRQEHLDQFMKSMTERFKPVVKNPDFFARPGPALNGQ